MRIKSHQEHIYVDMSALFKDTVAVSLRYLVA